jgi:hypothetical protein
MQPLIKRLKELETQVDAALARLNIDDKKADVEALEALPSNRWWTHG